MRDYDKPLSVILTGEGSSADANTEALLGDFVFGNLDNVDVKFIVPFAGKTSTSMNGLFKILFDNWGIAGKDFLPIVEPDSGNRIISRAESTEQVDRGCSIEVALNLLGQEADKGRDVAFISLYNPDSLRDLDDLENAKRCDGLVTLNLCEGLIDSFPGYESDEDREMREALQAAYDEQEKARLAAEKEAAPKPALKTAAKKATTPRKRAAVKSLEAEDVPAVEESEKAPVAPHTHKFVWVDDNKGKCGSYCECGQEDTGGTSRLVANAVAREAEKKAAKGLALSAEIKVGSVTKSDETPSIKEIAAELVTADDVWKDVAAAAPAQPTLEYTATDVELITQQQKNLADTIMVNKADIVELADAMQEMSNGFSKALSAYRRMVTGE